MFQLLFIGLLVAAVVWYILWQDTVTVCKGDCNQGRSCNCKK